MGLNGPAKLNEELLDELREAFAIYDINGDGKITTRELCTVMRQLGQNPTEAEILDMIKELDTDCSGSIGFNEFTLLMADKMNKVDTEEDVLAAFRVFDANGNGFITAVELRQVVENLGEKLTAEETKEMVKAIDSDSDGLINYEDFKNLMIPK